MHEIYTVYVAKILQFKETNGNVKVLLTNTGGEEKRSGKE